MVTQPSFKKTSITIITIISLLLISLIGACNSKRANEPGIQRYDLKGRVEAVDFERKRVTVAHEDIKGYMDAMTMSFAVKDDNILHELKSGDQINAILVQDSSTNRSWLEDIKLAR